LPRPQPAPSRRRPPTLWRTRIMSTEQSWLVEVL
jgi:hypothetical protein